MSQPSCSHSKTMYEIQLQKTLRMQPKQEATLTQPFQCDLRRLSCKTQETTCNGIGNCSSKTGSRRQSEKKTILKHFLKGFLEGKSLAPKWRKSADKSLWQPSCSTTCNPIYSEGTILELQITMEFHQQLIHQHHLQPHLQCGNDPTVANHNGILSTTHARKTVETPFTMRNRSENDPRISENDPTTHETVSHPSHRRGRSSRFGDGLCMEKHRVSCICYLSKTHFVRDFLQNSIGNSSTSTTCNPIYSEGTILELQITMEFHQQLIHQHHLQPHLQCMNDPTVTNHNGILSTTHARKTVETPFTMRNRSDHDPSISAHDPTTHETVSHPSHRRGRSSRFGDGLCMEKHRVSCICYLSKTHFVRDFLQNSIGNSSTSTTCNPIYSEGTILELQITMEFHQQLIHQHHLQPHLQCGNNPTVANHNGILSTTHARKTVETPFTMRNRSENDPRISENDPTTHETVSHPSHRRGRSSRFGDGLCMEKHRVSCICYLSKTHFVRDFLQNSIGNSSTSTTCNPICSEGTILELQITMEFHQQLIHQHHLQPHLQCGNNPTVANHNGILSTTHARKTVETPFTMRNRSENDPRMIRPHTRPSRTRRTAEVDHRGSGTDFVWKNIGFLASAISQKRISCETFCKTPSATPPPAPLAIPFTVRERS